MVYLLAGVQIRHPVPFHYLHSLVLAQRPYDLPQICSVLVVVDLSLLLWRKHHMILAHPLGMRQTVCLVCHTSLLPWCNRPEQLYYTAEGALLV